MNEAGHLPERIRSRIQVVEISFLQRIAGLCLSDKVRCWAI